MLTLTVGLCHMQRPGSVLMLWLWPWVADRHQHDSSRCGTRHAALSTTSSQQTHVLVLQTSADQHALEAVAAPLLFHRCCDRASKALHSHGMIGTAGCATRDPGRVCGRVLAARSRARGHEPWLQSVGRWVQNVRRSPFSVLSSVAPPTLLLPVASGHLPRCCFRCRHCSTCLFADMAVCPAMFSSTIDVLQRCVGRCGSEVCTVLYPRCW